MTGGEYGAAVRVMQRIKEQASSIKSLKDSSSASRQARKLSAAVDSTGFDSDKSKQAEESFRTVMYLSCWGPN